MHQFIFKTSLNRQKNTLKHMVEVIWTCQLKDKTYQHEIPQDNNYALNATTVVYNKKNSFQ